MILHNTSAATASAHRRDHDRVASQTDPAIATVTNTATTSKATLRNSNTVHSSSDPTITMSPNSICNTGPV